MGEKKVRTIDDIIFENEVPPVTIPKGNVFFVESVKENGIILAAEDGEQIMIDLLTFENGFEIAP